MNDADIAAPVTGLSYEDTLPIRWEPAEPPNAGNLLSLNQSNEQLLRQLAAMEEHRSEADEEGPSSHDLQRIEFKVNLLMDMVGQVLSRQLALPASAPVRLGAEEMQWTIADGARPREGERLRVEVWPDRRYPTPLVLLGTVTSVRTAEDLATITLGYVGMGDGLRGALEKMIFRQHRRLVAHARQAARKGGQ